MKTLQELREAKGLSIKELAKQSDIRVKAIEKIEKQDYKNVWVHEVKQLCHYFGTYEIKDLTVFDEV